MKMITVNDFAKVIADMKRDGISSIRMAKILATMINDRWHDSSKDVGDKVIGEICGMDDEDWKVYYRVMGMKE